jgi:hypothetical protein
VFEDRQINNRLWPPTKYQDLNPCDSYLRGNLRNKVYSNNPHTMDELKNICEIITSIKVSELKLVSNFSRHLEVHSRTEEIF